MKSTILGAACLVALGSLSGCGSNADDTAAKSISASMMKENDATLKLTQKQADCVGNGFVDKVGVDNLKKYKLLDKNNKVRESVSNVKLSKKDADSAADVIVECTDAGKLIKASLGSNVDAKTSACVDKVLTDDNVHALFAAIFSGDRAGAQAKLTAPMTKCLTG